MAKRPNVLLFMVDELRYPTVYDSDELKAWMFEHLVAQKALRERGVDFQRHYTQSTACAPSRTSLFTGQYPTLHGVSQTDGMGKTAWDPGMSWLDPNSVPTMGDWFRAAGYRTYYKGKWHISHADILIPGTHDSLMSNTDAGIPILENVDLYKAADRLDDFGFSGWIGPEPHGQAKANSGWMRDPGYMHQAVSLIDELESSKSDEPWLVVNSFVNPHDIVFFGLVWGVMFDLPYPTPDQVPQIAAPPTQNETLDTKPAAQASYNATYPQMFLPQPTIELYRRFYYFLQINVEKYILHVYNRLQQSRFRDDTIVVFTSDHGDMLGAHGGMHQKWYNAYEETIHVPLIISGKPIGDTPRAETGITSHADLLPTLLGLAGIDVEEAAKKLAQSHTETRPLVGRDLSAAVLGTAPVPPDPVFFMTYDDVSQGLSQITGGVTGNRTWESVVTPNQVETVIVQLDGALWKYSEYTQENKTPYDGLVTNPNILDKVPPTDVPAQYEMYKLTDDPTEAVNLAFPGLATTESTAIQPQLAALLAEQRTLKCLVPVTNQGIQRQGGEGRVDVVVPNDPAVLYRAGLTTAPPPQA